MSFDRAQIILLSLLWVRILEESLTSLEDKLSRDFRFQM